MKYSARHRIQRQQVLNQRHYEGSAISKEPQARVEAREDRSSMLSDAWVMVIAVAVVCWLGLMASQSHAADKPANCPDILNHDMKQLHSSKVLNLCDVAGGKPVLLVNTASHCGFTDQFGDLEKLHESYKDRGLVVIGVSSDSFNQEAESEEEAADVCFENFGVTFTMLSTVPVRGDTAHPLFRAVGDAAGYPKWNFYKYLLNRDGQVVDSWSSISIPSERELTVVF